MTKAAKDGEAKGETVSIRLWMGRTVHYEARKRRMPLLPALDRSQGHLFAHSRPVL